MITLLVSAENGYLSELKLLLSKGFDFDPYEVLVLTYAAWYGRLNVVSYLLSLTVNPANRDFTLFAAANRGCLDIVKYIYRSIGPSLNYNKALVYASEEGHLNVVRYLVSVGIDASSKEVLEAAAKGKHLALISFLQDNRLQVDTPHLGLSLSLSTLVSKYY